MANHGRFGESSEVPRRPACGATGVKARRAPRPAATCGDSFEATVDEDGPEVSITEPVSGEEFERGAEVTIAIDAIDAGYGVQEVWIEIAGMEEPVRETYPPFRLHGRAVPRRGLHNRRTRCRLGG